VRWRRPKALGTVRRISTSRQSVPHREAGRYNPCSHEAPHSMSDPQSPRPPLPPTQPTRPLQAPPSPPPLARAPVVPPAAERLPAELPPPDPWWGNPWPAILTGILGLLIGAALGYALSGGKNETVTEAQRAGGPAVTQTVTSTRTVPKVVVRTTTVTSNTVTPTPAPANAGNEERRVEAETRLRKAERENEELKRQQGEG
jgi:hypothetical protein